MVMQLFGKIVGENHMCSHPHTGDTTAEKSQEKKTSREFNELKFSRQNHGTFSLHNKLARSEIRCNPFAFSRDGASL